MVEFDFAGDSPPASSPARRFSGGREALQAPASGVRRGQRGQRGNDWNERCFIGLDTTALRRSFLRTAGLYWGRRPPSAARLAVRDDGSSRGRSPEPRVENVWLDTKPLSRRDSRTHSSSALLRAPASHALILTAPPRVPSWCPLTPSPRTSCEKLSARDGFRPKTGDPGQRASQTAPLRLRVLGARRAHPSPVSHLVARRRRGPRRVPGAWRRRWRLPGPSARTRRLPAVGGRAWKVFTP